MHTLAKTKKKKKSEYKFINSILKKKVTKIKQENQKLLQTFQKYAQHVHVPPFFCIFVQNILKLSGTKKNFFLRLQQYNFTVANFFYNF